MEFINNESKIYGGVCRIPKHNWEWERSIGSGDSYRIPVLQSDGNVHIYVGMSAWSDHRPSTAVHIVRFNCDVESLNASDMTRVLGTAAQICDCNSRRVHYEIKNKYVLVFERERHNLSASFIADIVATHMEGI